MSTVQSILVLVGLGGGSFIPAFVASDARWGLIVLFFLLFLLTAWAGYRLYCAAQPRFRVVPSIDIHPLSSSDMEALVVLTVENLSPVRLHDVIATLKAIRPLYDGADQDDQLERQLSPENYDQNWHLRWRGTAQQTTNIDSSAILEIASIRTNQDIGDACVLPRQGNLPAPYFSTLHAYEVDIEIAPENGARRMQTFRLQMRKSNPPSAEFTAL